MRKISLFSAGFLLVFLGIAISWFFLSLQPESRPALYELSLPRLIDSREVESIELSLQDTQHEFFPGVESLAAGFSQSYLGPTIRLYEGDDTRIRFTNELTEATSVHGHGLHVSGEVDGGPQSRIEPGETWDVTLPIRQEASTNWYHPHLMGSTAHQVHSGLAGLYLIEDENSQSLPLPKQYGVDDIPLIVQDRDFQDGVMTPYSITMDEMMNGKREDTLVVNGTVDPYMTVPQGWVRLRLLNASNARFYDFHFSGETFYVIATEGGFLEEPAPVTSLSMSPGERNEIMIDLSDGEGRDLLAAFLPIEDDYPLWLFPERRVLELRVDPELEAIGQLPDRLNTIEWLSREDAVVTRTFDLEMNEEEGFDFLELLGLGGKTAHALHEHAGGMTVEHMNMFSINGESMDIDRINQRVKKGDTEIWRISGEDMDHPFHMHGTSFQILTDNGQPPAPEQRGWKDVIVVDGGTTEVIMRFDYEAPEEFPYMYHCHILEHEEGGMMGQFTVE